MYFVGSNKDIIQQVSLKINRYYFNETILSLE